MQSIQQLEDNITQLRRELWYQKRQTPVNHAAIGSLKDSIKGMEFKLDGLLYQQAEDEADRIEAIREELLCAYVL